MYVLKAGTRMIQDRKNIRSSTFDLYNTQLEEELNISFFAAKMLRKAFSKNSLDELPNNNKTKELFFELLDAGYIVEEPQSSDACDNIFLGEPFHGHYPLSSLSIELTNGCNLRCKHCYGSFPQTPKFQFVSFDWIKKSINELNALHVKRIALTGGESTIHPHFLEIAMFFLEHGFELTVFTNGYNPEIIQKLLAKSSQYYFTIKVSLDGLEDIHNLIRGSNNAYANTIKTLEAISHYDNVDLYISTVVMPQNIAGLADLETMIESQFPKAIHSYDMVFPLGNACDCAFSLSEIPQVDQNVPSLFSSFETSIYDKKKLGSVKPPRCSGGITQCTLMPDGFLKICNSACDKQFYFKYNAYSKGISFAWNNCGRTITKIRHEKAKQTPQCKKCQYSKECDLKDCRVLAWVYTGDAAKSNPITCYIRHKMKGSTEK